MERIRKRRFLTILLSLAVVVIAVVRAQTPPAPTPILVPATLSPRDAVLASSTGPLLYTRGDHFLVNPVEGCAVFVSVVLVAALIEMAIEKVKAVDSEYFQMVTDSIQQETLIVGLMTLLLIFIISLGELRLKWVILLNYAVMSLLFMVVFFVVIIGACAVVLRVHSSRWRDFEGSRMDADPLLSRREVVFKQCRDRFRESVAASDVKYFPEMQFSDYVRRVEKYTVSSISDLSWKSWALLSLLVVMNGVRAKISMGSSTTSGAMTRQDRTINIVSYIAFVGYGPLLAFVLLHFMLQNRLAAFAEKPAVKIDEHTQQIEVVRPSELLFFRTLESTCHIFQTVILTMEWYLAIFALGMAKEAWSEFGVSAIAFYFFALSPAVIFIYLLPWTIATITMLSNLGADLHIKEATELSDDVRAQLGLAAANDEPPGGGKKDATTTAASALKKKHASVADEWRGDVIVSLHEKAADAKLLDNSVPIVTVGATGQHGVTFNKHVRAFAEKKERPMFREMSSNEQIFLPGDETAIVYGLPPPPPGVAAAGMTMRPMPPVFQRPRSPSMGGGGGGGGATVLLPPALQHGGGYFHDGNGISNASFASNQLLSRDSFDASNASFSNPPMLMTPPRRHTMLGGGGGL